jgi:hypothetical protein
VTAPSGDNRRRSASHQAASGTKSSGAKTSAACSRSSCQPRRRASASVPQANKSAIARRAECPSQSAAKILRRSLSGRLIERALHTRSSVEAQSPRGKEKTYTRPPPRSSAEAW